MSSYPVASIVVKDQQERLPKKINIQAPQSMAVKMILVFLIPCPNRCEVWVLNSFCIQPEIYPHLLSASMAHQKWANLSFISSRTNIYIISRRSNLESLSLCTFTCSTSSNSNSCWHSDVQTILNDSNRLSHWVFDQCPSKSIGAGEYFTFSIWSFSKLSRILETYQYGKSEWLIWNSLTTSILRPFGPGTFNICRRTGRRSWEPSSSSISPSRRAPQSLTCVVVCLKTSTNLFHPISHSKLTMVGFVWLCTVTIGHSIWKSLVTKLHWQTACLWFIPGCWGSIVFLTGIVKAE